MDNDGGVVTHWRKTRVRIVVVAGLLLALLTPAAVFGAGSPLGDSAAAWPPGWGEYTLADGSIITDVVGDENPPSGDMSSDCETNGCTGTAPTVLFSADGTNAFFRMRLHSNPADPSKGGIESTAYLVQIYKNGAVAAVAGVDGKSPHVDYVYVANAPGTNVTQIYTTPFNNSGGASSAGVRVVPTGTGDYFLDFQVPVARLTAISGGAITASTPVQLYYGTSQAANLATINKDFMLGDVSTVDLDGLSTVTLTPSTLDLSRTATHVSGPVTPTAGSTSVYDVMLTAANGGGGSVAGVTVDALAGARATIVSASTSAGTIGSASGSLTWTVGTIPAGATRTATVRVAVAPVAGDVGGNVVVLESIDAAGTDSYTGSARSDGAPDVTVGPVVAVANAAPVATDDTLTTNEDTIGSAALLANDTDADGDALVASLLAAPDHGTVSITSGVATYTPTANYAGPDSFTYQACDPDGACDTASVSVTVAAVNDAPVAANAVLATAEDTALVAAVTASDVDHPSLSYATVVEPSHGTLVLAPDGTFTYTPDANYVGADSFSFSACDASLACDSGTVSLTVQPANDTPIANGDAATVDEDGSVDVDVLANDIDVEGETLTAIVTSTPARGTATVVGGIVRYQPNADATGSDSFTYTACDPSSACSPATVTITITPVNDAPVAVNDTATVAEDGSVDLDVAANDSDVDGDTLTVGIVTPPVNGDVTIVAGEVRYTPAPDFSGTDTFTYQVCDGAASCDVAIVSVTITAVNDAPVAANGAVTTDEDTPVSGTLAGTDVDADALTFTLLTGPAKGGVTIGADGSFTYTPGSGEVGADSFTYRVCDGAGACDDATVSVTIVPADAVDAAPVASADVASVDEDESVDVDVRANDVDEDLAALVVTIVNGPAHGTASVVSGQVRYEPDANYNGTDTITYRVCDAAQQCDDATITIRVDAVNDAPNAAAASFVTDEGVARSGQLSATDGDGDDLVFTLSVAPTRGSVTVAPDGSFTYTPGAGATGADSFTYEVCDPSGACDLAVVTMRIDPADDVVTPPPATPTTTTTTAPATTTTTAQATTTTTAPATTDGEPLTPVASGSPLGAGAGMQAQPGVAVPPSEATSATAAPTRLSRPARAAGDQLLRTDQLPRTGAEGVQGQVLLAVLLLAVGTGLAVGTRRRDAQSDSGGAE